MGITTKKGDKGTTSLYWGGRISKDNIRVATYGTIDELCAHLGVCKSLVKHKRLKKLIETIQHDLFFISAELATKTQFLHRLKTRIDKSFTSRLEQIINELESKKRFKECCFYLPGENFISSTLDVARTVARRAEREVVTLKKKNILRNSYILVYLNRLSDLLYLLGRRYEKTPQRLQ
jgi:cob(I)alamin adenosyltransferase